MAGGYQVGIASETKAFKQGIESGIIDPLEDAQRELLDLGRNRGPEQLEKSMKDAERATEKLGDETKRTADTIEREFRDSYRKVKRAADDATDGGHKGMGKLRDGAQEVTQEVGQNLGEAVSSVRGDFSDLGQVGQDTLGGLAATLASTGPAGIAGAAALAAGATGLGFITAELEKQNEKAQELKEYFVDAWTAATEAGKDYIESATTASRITEIAQGADWADERTKAMEVEKATGLDLSLIYRALAGDMDAIGVVSKELEQAEKDRWKVYEDVGAGRKKLSEEEYARWNDEITAIRNTQDSVRRVGEEYQAAAKTAATGRDAVSDYWLEIISKADEATVEVDKFENKLVTLPSGEQVVIDAETGQAHKDVDRFKGDLDGIPETVKTKAIVEASVRSAQNEINRFVSRNNGRSIRLHGRFDISPIGGDV